MEKQNLMSSTFTLCLGFSAILNLLFFAFLLNSSNHSSNQLSWSRKAAQEAEGVSSLSCSGHGSAHLDGLISDGGKPVCECNACYTGPDCSQFIPDCVVDADSGNPLFLEPFWRKNAAKSTVVMSGWHRMGYEFEDGSLISKQLEKQIRRLHKTVGNAVTEGRYIVFGAGSTQLLNAAVHALSSTTGSSSPAKVVASAPYYPVYKSQTELFESSKFKFNGEAASWINNSISTTASSNNFIEFVTSPNNPDGQLNKAVLKGDNAKQIFDLAYYWPHYTAIPSPMDEDLMIFTLSKLTGHAGSRFGWAIIKDKDVYQRMVDYMDLNTYGVARETQLRTLKLLDVVLEENGRKMFDFGYEEMSFRWEKLSKILSSSKRFSLQELTPQQCTFSNEVRAPTPAFAWIRCENDEDEDCHAVLKEAKIIGRAGHVFGAQSRYVRLSLVNSQDDFNLLQHRLEMLVFKEKMANLMAGVSLGADSTIKKYNLSQPLNTTTVRDGNIDHHSIEESEESSAGLMHSTLNILKILF
ncbi:OLC1v1017622C1 [Oldenlandia corymbosa var. corymbosa]|uniref:OLC1v1017622C1 n=1 Tax=Oldenlandia corymbosa var. corymbosa TaxID=529605 RepID=A0AAV1E9V2_OLDCO|nr:OLC1v1017622C1 [Oldenlandia corymbosa var. corymbosa]